MKIELLGITQNADEFIGRCAAICYDSKLDADSCVKRASHCKDRGHLATMRFAHATFAITGISRACSHQLVRSKHLDFLQESQRYVDNVDDLEYVTPESIAQNPKALEYYDAVMTTSARIYRFLRKEGVKKEDARMVLPNAACTKINATGNFQAWKDFIELRSDPAAQWEIREVALRIKEILHGSYPVLF